MKQYLCSECNSPRANHRPNGKCRACAYKAISGKNHWNYKDSTTCPQCKNKKSTGRKVCRKCYLKNNVGENHWNFGNHWSDEVKMKISLGNTGKRMGEENHKFNPNKEIRRTYRFPHRLWKKNVLDRDNNTCRICSSKENPNVHHITPYKNSQNNTDIENGITLCEKCHQITFGREYLFINLFKEILNNEFNSVETFTKATPSQQEKLRKVLWACVTVRGE
jgi:hypothetical protein